MNPWTFLLGGTVFLGLFLAVRVLAGPGARAARSLLALLLGSVSVLLLEFLRMQNGYYAYPVVFLTYPLVFVHGPAFLLLARAQTGFPLRARDALHVLPLLLFAANQLPYYADALSAGTAHGVRPRLFVPLGGYAMMILHLVPLGIYVLLGVRMLRRRAAAQAGVDSGAVVEQARWLVRTAIAFAGILALQIVAAIGMMTTHKHIDSSEYGMALAIGAVIVTMGWTVARNARLLEAPVAITAPAAAAGDAAADAGDEKYRKSALDDARTDDYRRRLLDHFEREKPYLEADLRLAALAAATGIPEHHLSQTLNGSLGVTFFDFVNRYRVRHAAGLLRGGDDRKVLAVAFDSGFSSKASFHRAFKRHTGMTPTEYRERGAALPPVALDPASGDSSPAIGSHPAG